MIESRRISELGVETRVLESGDRDADEAIVFLHGQPGSADDWADLMRRAAPLGRVVAFDWPGWGEAERPSRDSWDYSAATSATYLAAVLANLRIRRAHLVMHDLGGVAILWGAAHPKAFASAVIIDTGGLLDFRWDPLARLMRAPILGEVLLPLATRLTFRAFVRYYNPQPRPLPREVVDRWWASYDLATRRAMRAFYRATPERAMERLRVPLASMDVPALVLWGSTTPRCPSSRRVASARAFPAPRSSCSTAAATGRT